jgi:hypothetical protein
MRAASLLLHGAARTTHTSESAYDNHGTISVLGADRATAVRLRYVPLCTSHANYTAQTAATVHPR